MKKLIALLLSLVMVLSLAACGKHEPVKDDDGEKENTVQTDATEPESTEPKETEPEETDLATPVNPPEENGGWTFKQMALPEIPTITWQEKEGCQLVVSPIACDVEALCEYLKTIPYIAEQFTSFSVSETERMMFDDNEMISASVVDALTVSNGSGYIKIAFYADPDSYINYYGVNVLMDRVELTAELQSALIDAFSHVGLDAMTFVLQAKDLDGKRFNGDDFGVDHTEDSMSEKVEYDDHFYGLMRTFLEGEKYYSFDYDVRGIQNSNYGEAAKLFSPSYQTLPYRLSDQFNGDFGEADPFAGENFGNTLLASLFADYQSSQIDSLEYKVSKYGDGATSYAICCKFSYVNGENDDDSPTMQIGMSYTVQDGEVYGTLGHVEMLGVEATRKGATKEILFREGVRVLQTLFPESDLSSIVYDENERSVGEKITYKILGDEVESRFIIRYEDEDLSIGLNTGFSATI